MDQDQHRRSRARRSPEALLAWRLMAPALIAVAGIGVFPLGWTLWESLHLHDLRMPWLGRPLIGLDNYAEAAASARFWAALLHTTVFTAVTVTLEVLLGMTLALALDRTFRGRGLLRTLVLLPWCLPTVVSALLWSFLFDGQAGAINALLVRVGLMDPAAPLIWVGHPLAAWVPLVVADVWKMTPFVTLLLLAGLQGVDRSLLEAAALDGAGAWQRFQHVILPLLKPALLVTLVFRTLDGFRVFDLVYVLTQGGPGTTTEPITMYAFSSLLQHLRFGYGAALSVVVFLVTLLLALLWLRILGRGAEQ